MKINNSVSLSIGFFASFSTSIINEVENETKKLMSDTLLLLSTARPRILTNKTLN